jgi:hypothetical protein
VYDVDRGMLVQLPPSSDALLLEQSFGDSEHWSMCVVESISKLNDNPLGFKLATRVSIKGKPQWVDLADWAWRVPERAASPAAGGASQTPPVLRRSSHADTGTPAPAAQPTAADAEVTPVGQAAASPAARHLCRVCMTKPGQSSSAKRRSDGTPCVDDCTACRKKLKVIRDAAREHGSWNSAERRQAAAVAIRDKGADSPFWRSTEWLQNDARAAVEALMGPHCFAAGGVLATEAQPEKGNALSPGQHGNAACLTHAKQKAPTASPGPASKKRVLSREAQALASPAKRPAHHARVTGEAAGTAGLGSDVLGEALRPTSARGAGMLKDVVRTDFSMRYKAGAAKAEVGAGTTTAGAADAAVAAGKAADSAVNEAVRKCMWCRVQGPGAAKCANWCNTCLVAKERIYQKVVRSPLVWDKDAVYQIMAAKPRSFWRSKAGSTWTPSRRTCCWATAGSSRACSSAQARLRRR